MAGKRGAYWVARCDGISGRLTQQMNWPHRLEDWQDALLLGEGLVAEEQGQPVGTALCWRWGERWATIGLVVVDGRQQGRGIGRALMTQAMA